MQSSTCQLPTTSKGCRDCSEWSPISQSSSQAPQRLPRLYESCWRRTCLGIGLRNVKLHSTRSKKLCPPVKSWDSSDVTKPVVLQTDASKRALGAVLLQEGFPVAYASRTMTATQERYAQIEKELLAVVFACERFHQPGIPGSRRQSKELDKHCIGQG